MNCTRVALVTFVAAAALAAWPRRDVVVDTHGPTRQFVIRSTLLRVDDAIVVLGDSIVEASTLPRTLCGRPVVNAGIGGASTASGLGSVLAQALGGKRAAMIVVSLGTNDAARPNSVETFTSNYRALLGELTALTPNIAIAGVPLPEAGLDESKNVNFAAIDSYNVALPELAGQVHAAFISLPPMPARHTIDGLHLNGAGYDIWDKAIAGGIQKVLCKAS
jgi:lysophospholipase L1-like esterase